MAVEYTAIETTTFKDRTLDATAEEIATSAKTLFGIELDNTQNTVDSFCKLYNVASAPSIGTTVPDKIFRVKAGAKTKIPLGSDGSGIAFGTGVFAAGVTTGGTGGTTSPTNPFLMTLYTN